MSAITQLSCQEAAPAWFHHEGLRPQGLPGGSLRAAAWLAQRYPDRSQAIPLRVESSAATISLAFGALLSGHRLLLLPTGHQSPEWLQGQLTCAEPLRPDNWPDSETTEVQAEQLNQPAAFGSWLIFGSGERGGQKMVAVGWPQLAHAAAAQSAHLGLNENDCWLSCLPLDHIGGLMSIWRMAWVGGSISLHHRFSAEAVAADLKNCTGISLVPTMAWRLCKLTLPNSRINPWR